MATDKQIVRIGKFTAEVAAFDAAGGFATLHIGQHGERGFPVITLYMNPSEARDLGIAIQAAGNWAPEPELELGR